MKTPSLSLHANHGFTLVEVMLALVILGIGILSIVALQPAIWPITAAHGVKLKGMPGPSTESNGCGPFLMVMRI